MHDDNEADDEGKLAFEPFSEDCKTEVAVGSPVLLYQHYSFSLALSVLGSVCETALKGSTQNGYQRGY